MKKLRKISFDRLDALSSSEEENLYGGNITTPKISTPPTTSPPPYTITITPGVSTGFIQI